RDRHRAGRVVHGGAVPRRRRLGGRHVAVRPGQRAHALMVTVRVCVKRVPDSSSQGVLTPDSQAVDGRMAGYTISPHEECAIELAVRLADATRGGGTPPRLRPGAP